MQRLEQHGVVAAIDLEGGAPRRTRKVGQPRRQRPQQRFVGGRGRADHDAAGLPVGRAAAGRTRVSSPWWSPRRSKVIPRRSITRTDAALGASVSAMTPDCPSVTEQMVEHGAGALGGQALAPPRRQQAVQQLRLAVVGRLGSRRSRSVARLGGPVDPPDAVAARAKFSVARRQRLGRPRARMTSRRPTGSGARRDRSTARGRRRGRRRSSGRRTARGVRRIGAAITARAAGPRRPLGGEEQQPEHRVDAGHRRRRRGDPPAGEQQERRQRERRLLDDGDRASAAGSGRHRGR